MSQIFRRAVGGGPLELRPHKLVRIELGRVGWKALRVQARILFKTFPHARPSMHISVVPQKNHGAAQVAKQVPQELCDLRVADVLARMKADVKPHPLPFWRDAERREGRCFCPVAGAAKKRRLASRRPRAHDVGNQQKPALIEEYEMGAKYLGFFLSEATRRASNARWPLRRARGLAFPASDSSSRVPPKAARCGWDGRRLRSAERSPRPTRRVVHKSVVYPQARGPLKRIRTNPCFCRFVSLGGRPAIGLGFRASLPPRRRCSRHRCTELAEHPIL